MVARFREGRNEPELKETSPASQPWQKHQQGERDPWGSLSMTALHLSLCSLPLLGSLSFKDFSAFSTFL